MDDLTCYEGAAGKFVVQRRRKNRSQFSNTDKYRTKRSIISQMSTHISCTYRLAREKSINPRYDCLGHKSNGLTNN